MRWTTLALLGALGCGHRGPGALQETPPQPEVGLTSEPASTSTAGVTPEILAALAHPDRPADDKARDAARRPGEVLAFAGLSPGHTVLDLMTGRGWYAEIAGRVVGPEGQVYAQNNAFVVERFADGPLNDRLAGPGHEQVTRLDAELDALGLPDASVDLALFGLFYHDMYWMNLDRSAVNAEIYRVLAPGGTYVVFDHHAAEGRGLLDVETLHRVERHLVVEEILAAGFVLEAESDVLRHPGDPRTANVFDDEIRGQTDRFLLRFRKPTAPATP